MKRLRSSCVALLTGALLFAAATPSAAGPQDPAAVAQTALAEGRALREKGDLAGARARFRAAWNAQKSAVAGYELATVLRSLGDLNGAYDVLVQVSELKVSGPDEVDAQRDAAALFTVVDAAIPMVLLDLGALGDQVDKVIVDGEVLPREEWGEAQPVNPGKREIVVVLRDGSGLKKTITLEERARARLVFKMPGAAAAAPGAAAAAPGVAPVVVTPAPTAAPGSCPAPSVLLGADCVVKRNYGWQLALADGLTTGMMVLGALAIPDSKPEGAISSEEEESDGPPAGAVPFVIGLIGFPVASPIVHWSHGRVGRGFASFGFHAGALIGFAATLASMDEPKSSSVALAALGFGAIGFGLDYLIIPHETESKVSPTTSASGWSLPRIGVAPIRGGAAASLQFTF